MRKFYKYYFEQKAIKNDDINHSEADKAFYVIDDIYNPDAFDAALATAGRVAFILEAYTKKNTGGANRNYISPIAGRFNILVAADISDPESIDTAKDDAEAIADEIICKMREELSSPVKIKISDGVESKPAYIKPETEITLDPIGPMYNKYFGFSVGFEMHFQARGNSNPAKWNT